jgi:CheY-like chemotaxis protein
MWPESILVVDDNQDDVFLLKHSLRTAGFINPIHTLDTGLDAMHYLQGTGPYQDRSKYPYPAFLLLDLHLPLQTGFDVLEWLKKNPQPNLKVVICTGTASPEEIEKAYKLGAERVLEKTSNFSDFIKMLTNLPGIAIRNIEEGRELVPA